ncbi:MAG: molybdate ABC transporter substrate-binding protein [Acidobacteriota bacterium]
MNAQCFKQHLSWLGILVLALVGFSCRSAKSVEQTGKTRREITVSAAASLQDAFREIGKQLETRTDTRVNFNFGASGALQKQIESGAPVDVFASAGRPQMDPLVLQGLIAPESRRDFARNALVLVVPADQTVELKGFADLGSQQVKRIAVGNPKTVPAGQYSEQSLTRLGLWQRLQSRLVFGEDVRQVLDYVSRGEVEAGLVYASDVRVGDNRVRVVACAPADSHDPILYPIGVVLASKQSEAAHSFIDAVMSDEGQRILEKYGFERIR